jgi:COMPASS component SWD3
MSTLAAADKLVKIWDVETGEPIRTIRGHKEGLSDLAWSSDSKYICTACDDGSIGIWIVESVRVLLSVSTISH